MVKARWTRDPDTASYLELIGDLMELSLGTGYIDQQRYWRIIAQVSPIVEEIRQTLLYLDYNGSFSRTGRQRPFFRGPCAPLSRRISQSIYNAMVVHKFNIQESSEEWNSFLQVASHSKLLYSPAYSDLFQASESTQHEPGFMNILNQMGYLSLLRPQGDRGFTTFLREGRHQEMPFM